MWNFDEYEIAAKPETDNKKILKCSNAMNLINFSNICLSKKLMIFTALNDCN